MWFVFYDQNSPLYVPDGDMVVVVNDRPTGLSDWDKALLTELYRSDPQSRSQRLEVSMHMVNDIER